MNVLYGITELPVLACTQKYRRLVGISVDGHLCALTDAVRVFVGNKMEMTEILHLKSSRVVVDLSSYSYVHECSL